MEEIHEMIRENEENEIEVIEMEPEVEEEKSILGKVLGVAAVGVAGALVTLKLTKKKRDEKRKEKYIDYLCENGYLVAKKNDEEESEDEVLIVDESEE